MQLDKLMKYLAVGPEAVQAQKHRLDQIRNLCHEIDRMTWQDNLVKGGENHYYLVSSSDFNSDPDKFADDLRSFIVQARQRDPFNDEIRLAYIGVPPIFTDLYETLEDMGARVVYNEVQRQFAMPLASNNIVDQYLNYTYPYGAFARLEDITAELQRRVVTGVIHYTQLLSQSKINLPAKSVCPF
jgi:benzoyl-CoA reductase/2-hydroxyglutaryl-CoA dehydratase subunit BcrC/BadD/HgdB